VHVGDVFVNGELVAGGFARTLEIEPNTSRAGRLGRLETAAGREGRGLWAACEP
jgi:endonuclease YncB( thermonuclease family)